MTKYYHMSTTSDGVEPVDAGALVKALGRPRHKTRKSGLLGDAPEVEQAELKGWDIDEMREQFSPTGVGDAEFFGGHDSTHPALFEQFVTFEDLRLMSEVPLVSAVLETRIAQVRAFCVPDTDDTEIGYSIVPRDTNARVTREMRRKMAHLTDWVRGAGRASEYLGKVSTFETQTAQFLFDSLAYDHCALEIPTTRLGEPVAFIARDPATIRYSAPTVEEKRAGRRDPKNAGFYQVMNGRTVAAWSREEMISMIRRPRTDVRMRGYGRPELVEIMGRVADIVDTEDYNSNNFRNGTQARGVFLLKSRMARQKFRAWSSNLRSLMSGVENAHSFANIRLDPGENEDLKFIDLTKTNRDMEYMEWLRWLARLICAKFLMDPAEIGINLGVEGWFSDRVRLVVGNSLAAAEAYEAEQREGEASRDRRSFQVAVVELTLGWLDDGEQIAGEQRATECEHEERQQVVSEEHDASVGRVAPATTESVRRARRRRVR